MLTLLIVGNESFRNGLSNSIDLCNMTTATHSHSDIDSRELFLEHKMGASPFYEKPHLVRTRDGSKERIIFRMYY